ncbi:MAG: diaminopimelate epimerase [Pseudomonadota bacterium]
MPNDTDTIPFWKMSGAGNDFIIIDNRGGVMDGHDMAMITRKLCCRKLSVGSDGLILIEADPDADFRWRFYNSDGGMAEMCGNGARCAARFAVLNGIAGERMVFITAAGPIEAHVTDSVVRVRMTDPSPLESDARLSLAGGDTVAYSFINTGVPHAVVPVTDIAAVNVVDLGRRIRRHDRFSPAGTNANFIQPIGEGAVAIRTYERGVEDETLACGTGAVAGALAASRRFGMRSPIRMKTRSGALLVIYFNDTDEGFGPVFMEGDARIIYTGKLSPEAWGY